MADDVNIRLGEFFSGNNQIRIVNTTELEAVAQVPENYLGQVNVGSNVIVVIPELNNKSIETKIAVTGKTIDASNRGFYVESKLPYEKDLYPNQVALIKIQDYTTTNALTIPVNSLQNDEKENIVLFALLFGLGIIVDDAIVERRTWGIYGRKGKISSVIAARLRQVKYSFLFLEEH